MCFCNIPTYVGIKVTNLLTKEPFVWKTAYEDNENTTKRLADKEEEYHKTKCNQWVNLSAFLARCTQAGMYDRYTDCFKCPSVDINLALENHPVPKSVMLKETRVLVATLWILHAGQAIYENLLKVDEPQWSVPAKWAVWEAKLKELENEEALSEEVKRVVGQTLERMAAVAITPS